MFKLRWWKFIWIFSMPIIFIIWRREKDHLLVNQVDLLNLARLFLDQKLHQKTESDIKKCSHSFIRPRLCFSLSDSQFLSVKVKNEMRWAISLPHSLRFCCNVTFFQCTTNDYNAFLYPNRTEMIRGIMLVNILLSTSFNLHKQIFVYVEAIKNAIWERLSSLNNRMYLSCIWKKFIFFYSQIERYGPYTALYGYFTTYKRTVYGHNIGHRSTALS